MGYNNNHRISWGFLVANEHNNNIVVTVRRYKSQSRINPVELIIYTRTGKVDDS